MTTERSYYALEPELTDDGAAADDFSAGRLSDWVSQVRALGLRQGAPRFVVQLERLSRLALPPARRVDALRVLLRPVVLLAAGLPEPADAGPGRSAGGALLIRQRLYGLFAKNLKQALRDLDRSEEAFGARAAADRLWLVDQLFRFLGRQIELVVPGHDPSPAGTWRELHDLYAYLKGRSGPDSDPTSAFGYRTFDPRQEYLKLLLLGLAARLCGRAGVPSRVLEQLPRWARQTRLGDPEAYVGAIRPYLVDITVDEPPHQHSGLLAGAFHGYVLVPPPDFAAAVESTQFGLPQALACPFQAATEIR